jgi:hypothetical protein
MLVGVDYKGCTRANNSGKVTHIHTHGQITDCEPGVKLLDGLSAQRKTLQGESCAQLLRFAVAHRYS